MSHDGPTHVDLGPLAAALVPQPRKLKNQPHPLGPRRERRSMARYKRRLSMALSRLDVVKPQVAGVAGSPAYAAYRAGLITRKQARLLGVVGAVLYRGPR